jgi:nucleotide-binding universal stress UspA family protein
LVDFAASEADVRMMVMATHGRTGFERWRLGNVTEKVVRHATVPVLVVPTREAG